MSYILPTPNIQNKFPLGSIAVTPGAMEALASAEQKPSYFLIRHVIGDWGDLDEEDKQANADALIDGCRILSAYHTLRRERIWIITEADRSATTILLPEEY